MGLQGLKTVFQYGLTVLGISIALMSCSTKKSVVPYYNTPDFTPFWLTNVPDTLHTISAFSLTDQRGMPVSDKTVNNKIYIANFFFTKCLSICPKMMKHIKMLADSFRDNSNIAFLSFSVTPELDSVPQLHKYAELKHINDERWHLLTGNKSEIYSLARKSFFAEGDIGFNADSSEFLHTEHILLVDRNKHLRGVYNGTVLLDIEKLKEDIRELLKE